MTRILARAEDTTVSSCGILLCYNEEHLLRESMTHYLTQGIDLVIVDNESTDNSLEIALELQQHSPGPGTVRAVESFESHGFEWKRLLRFCNDYAHQKLSHYDWLLLIDADAFFCSPVRGLSLPGFMTEAHSRDYTALNGALYNFYPTDRDGPQSASLLSRQRHFDRIERDRIDLPQERIFAYRPDLDFARGNGHVVTFGDKRVFPIAYHYRHYGWTSFEQGKQKVFRDRKPRYITEERNFAVHPPYNGLLPLREDFVKPHKTLSAYDEDRELLSQADFKRALARLPLHALGRRVDQFARRHLWPHWTHARALANRERLAAFVGLLPAKVREKIATARWARQYGDRFVVAADKSHFQTTSLWEQVTQSPGTKNLPHSFHFLPTAVCDAKCYFCNQKVRASEHMPLKEFIAITDNIPGEVMRFFHFSGGGEPLLCGDLPEMVNYTRATYPWVQTSIQTNALTLDRNLDWIINSSLGGLQISWHGATEATDTLMFGRPGFASKVDALRQLDSALRGRKKTLARQFSVAVEQRNIHELPDIVRLAKELGVTEVSATFIRYYPVEGKGETAEWPKDARHSLFFAQERYNQAVDEAKRVARSVGVAFSANRPFGHRPVRRNCRHPWTTAVIDWRGRLFPCPGGEVQFHSRVEAGDYDFGNLRDQSLAECIAKETYTAIRRTCDKSSPGDFIPECESCCVSLGLLGTDERKAHLLKWPEA